MQAVEIRFLRIRQGAQIPAYQTEYAAGLDLHACLEAPLIIAAGEIVVVPCGFSMSIPHGFEAQVRPRSGLATKHGIGIPNSPGTVDSDYRGEMMVPLINLGRSAFTVEHGMRIAQMVIAPVARAAVTVVDALDETSRGSGGFGSTGTGPRS